MTDEIHPTTYAVPRFRAAKRALVVLMFFAAFSAAAWFDRAQLLREAAELWIVSDSVVAADAVAILGGGLTTRPFAAAQYYRRGLVKKILLANVDSESSESIGDLLSQTALARSVLVKLGVPETAIDVFGTNLSNTHDEAVALMEWAVQNHARSLIVPTEEFSSRRVRWMMQHVLSGAGIQVYVPALKFAKFNSDAWWRSEQGVVNFQNEVLKYVYYRFKY